MNNQVFQLDNLVKIVISSGMSLCFLPLWGLVSLNIFLCGILLLCIVLIYAYLKRQIRLQSFCFLSIIFISCLFYFHSQAVMQLDIASKISQIKAEKKLEIKIIKIFKQTHYQTVLATISSDDFLNKHKIYLNWKSQDKVRIGEYWSANIQLKPIYSRLNIGGFDRQKWYLSQGIIAYGTVKSAVKKEHIFSWREKALALALQQTEKLPSQGLLMALGFGERAWLTNNLWQNYQQTNTAHLIAISGLHIGLAMFFGFILARSIQFFILTRWISPIFPIIVGLSFASFYAYLAGFSVPTLRAIVALIIISFFHFWRRMCTPWQLFFRVIALLCILDPMMVLSSSFWLSAGAVFCLIIWYQTVPLSLIKWHNNSTTIVHSLCHKKVQYILGLIHLQIGLLWLFTPIQLAMFNGFSTTGMIANLIVVPCFSLCIVPIVLFAVFTHGLWDSWSLANTLLEKINHIIFLLQGHWIPISNEVSYLISMVLIMLFGLCIYGIYFVKSITLETNQFFTSKPTTFFFTLNENRSLSFIEKRRLMVIGGTLLCYYFIQGYYSLASAPKWRLETLDVGQGLATLIVKDNRAILYDTGTGWKTGSMARLEIIPYLQRQGLILDKLIISHDDNDHSGGVVDILRAYPHVQLIATSTKSYGKGYSKNKEKFDRTFCKKGEQWRWNGLSFSVLSPATIVQRSRNEDSCVLLLSDGVNKVLLLGDATVAVEKKIVSSLGQIDILQVGHHGSKTSTSEILLQSIKPKIALISSGRWNPWHFPHKIVIQRLQKQKIQLFNTALSGQISIHFFEQGFDVKQTRNKFSPWFSGLIGMEGDLRLQ